MLFSWKKPILSCLMLTALLGAGALNGLAQQLAKSDRDLARSMLREVAADVQKHYYDPKLHGVDWDLRVRQARENIDKADSMNTAVAEIAALLDSLNDSHTFLIPPPRTSTLDYGFTMEMIGERCYVVRVRHGSDAQTKGLTPGDEILAVNEHPVSRKNLWRIQYIYDILRPQAGLRLTLADDATHQRQLDVLAKSEPSPLLTYFLPQGINQYVRASDAAHHTRRARYFEKGDALLVVRIPEFAFSADDTDKVIAKMRTHKGVVLDLRGNLGGYAETLDRLLGGMFERDLKVYDRISRNSTRAVSVSGRHHDAFIGRFVVLIDSESASASELFARVIQLERRGFIVGDRSAGMVMEAKQYSHEVYVDWGVLHGASVTDADLIMNDGKSLEHVGVEPDFTVLPTAGDLAHRRDPAMAKATGLVGVPLSPEEAGTMFPVEESNEP
jgi:C-terminal processing protease CtpA/Prc